MTGRQRRITVTVRWSAPERLWVVRRDDISGGVLGFEVKRALAIKLGRSMARGIAATGEKVELVIFTKDGKIGNGSDSRSTYGADPRKSKG